MDNGNKNGEGGVPALSRVLGIVILASLGFLSTYAAKTALEVAVEIARLQGQLNLLEARIQYNAKELERRAPYVFKKEN